MSAIGAPDARKALEHELAGRAPEERADLLEEVEASLLEIGGDPIARFGTSARFGRSRPAASGSRSTLPRPA